MKISKKTITKKILQNVHSIIVFLILFFINTAQAVTIRVPRQGTSEDYVLLWQEEITANEKDILATIQLINKYLRFTIWLVLFVIIIISGFKIMVSHWDGEKLKSNVKIIWYSFIWLGISILSYAIVRIVINLF